ncbi:dolichyl-phosphate-mannose-protein mannosyltransferase [Terracoccus luteus]|uniref:Dolichyl-phosphate-mannose-protein mannosyltransferase n=1 Tax=Terracoccus luteus TaxID=53356 RepID=A0A495XZE8_9MICO|nr:glycosyltransferase family 39 protein [Terracoccus luteus]RKT79312.1 dolichyl-phosphate-mannose-protein mannosyltransferase [Terracoccus luteus]
MSDPPALPRLAGGPVGSALAALAVALTVAGDRYGWFRDELYFRLLPPRLAYVDQPPFTPLLVRGMSAVVDEVWAVRLPATAAAVLAVLLVALLTREVGGGRLAQGLAAWGYAFAAIPVAFGHTAITAGWDVVAWLTVALLVVRAVLRDRPRLWVWAGVVVGLACWNKLLVPLLLASLAVGLLVCGPRRLPWRHVLLGAGLAAVVAAPQLLYQATNDWPQLGMARALSAQSGSANRVLLVPFLLVLLGPVLVPVWVAGVVSLLRRPDLRPLRFLAVAVVASVALVGLGSGSPYYVLGLLAAAYAVGCVPVARWLTSRPDGVRRREGLRAVAANGLVGAVVGLPVLPLAVVAATPVPQVNVGLQGSVGWPEYVDQVAAVVTALDPTERAGAGIVTSTFGEAGAVDRFGRPLGLPAPASGHNALADVTAPPDGRVTLVVVGDRALAVARGNATCTVVSRLDHGLGVDGPEQGQPVAVCRDPAQAWTAVWPRFRYLG